MNLAIRLLALAVFCLVLGVGCSNSESSGGGGSDSTAPGKNVPTHGGAKDSSKRSTTPPQAPAAPK